MKQKNNKNKQISFLIGNKKIYSEICLLNIEIPILFICEDDDNQRYLVLCIDEDEYIYIISKIKISDLIDLLSGTLSLRNAFLKNETQKVITSIKGYQYDRYEFFSKKEIKSLYDDDCDYYEILEPKIEEYLKELKEEYHSCNNVKYTINKKINNYELQYFYNQEKLCKFFENSNIPIQCKLSINSSYTINSKFSKYKTTNDLNHNSENCFKMSSASLLAG